MEIEITKKVMDKETKETFEPGTTIERSKKRAQDFVKKGFAKEVIKPEETQNVDQTVSKPKRKKKTKK